MKMRNSERFEVIKRTSFQYTSVKMGRFDINGVPRIRNKNVLLLDTLHSNVVVSDNEKKAPNTVAAYNAIKYGVDVVDQTQAFHKICFKKPVQAFFNILNLASINSWVVYREVTGSNMKQ